MICRGSKNQKPLAGRAKLFPPTVGLAPDPACSPHSSLPPTSGTAVQRPKRWASPPLAFQGQRRFGLSVKDVGRRRACGVGRYRSDRAIARVHGGPALPIDSGTSARSLGALFGPTVGGNNVPATGRPNADKPLSVPSSERSRPQRPRSKRGQGKGAPKGRAILC